MPLIIRRSCLAALMLVALALTGCDKSPKAPEPSLGPAVVIRDQKGNDWTIFVELARTPREKAQGLMYRWSLEKDHGMLFIYEDAAVRKFWMKNTRIPLDMIFIGPDMRVAGMVEKTEPYTETSRFVPAPSQWVLEVSGGEAADHGIMKGDRVYFFNFQEYD